MSTSYDQLEHKFWSSITFNRALYGADVEASVSDEDLEHWNLRNLNTILHETLTEDIAGVNTRMHLLDVNGALFDNPLFILFHSLLVFWYVEI